VRCAPDCCETPPTHGTEQALLEGGHVLFRSGNWGFRLFRNKVRNTMFRYTLGRICLSRVSSAFGPIGNTRSPLRMLYM
jgi:hypothetical protein